MKDVFISYKAEEIQDALWVKAALEDKGIGCWMAPDDIPGGSSYATEIPQAIRQCKVFILILSAKTQASVWVSREIDLALNERKTVMPFMLEDCPLQDDFQFYLTNVQRYAAFRDKDAAMQKMLQQIQSLLGVAPQATPAKEEPVASVPKSEPVQHLPAHWMRPEDISAKVSPKVAPLPKKKVNIFCLLCFIFGLSSLLLGTFFFPQIAAIVFGCLGANRLKNPAYKGKGLAIAGLVVGLVMLTLVMTVLLSIIGMFLALLLAGGSLLLFLRQLKASKKP